MSQLITEHLAIWTTAPKGIKKLRELILELAVRGLLVPQDANDEPASELLTKIAAEKARLVSEGKIKPPKPLANISEEEKPFGLPMGWEWVRLGDYCDVRDGTHDSPKAQLSGYPLITSKNLYSGKLDFTHVNFISEEEHLKIIERSRVDRNDILFAMIGSIGNPVIVNTDIEFSIKNVALFKQFSDNLSVPEFLKIYLELATVAMKEQSSGGVQPFVSLGKLRAYLMPLPPLAEQQRIVAKVDELMQLCDQLEQKQNGSEVMHRQLVNCLLSTLTEASDAQAFQAAWSRIAANFDCLFTTEHSIEQLKQTILQLAVMGKLVPQNPNDEPASELLNKIATEKARLITEGKIRKQNPLPKISAQEKPFALPNGWEWVRLQNILDVRDGTHDSPKSATGENTYPLVTSKDFDKGIIKFDSAKRISAQDHDEISKRSYVEQFDILFSMIGGNIGNQVMVKEDNPFSIKNVALFKYYNKELTPPFYIKKITEHLALDLQTKAAGGAQPFVGLGFLRNIVIALPPVNEQHRIVTKVDELLTLCEQLKTKLATAKTLQQQLAETLVQQAVA